MFGKKRQETEDERQEIEDGRVINSQIAHLDKLLKDNSIDEDTYERYKKLLKMSIEKKQWY